MTARCTECGRYHNFSNSRGAKLSERSCPCGGKLEILSHTNIMSTETWIDGVTKYLMKNKKGDLFMPLYTNGRLSHFNKTTPK